MADNQDAVKNNFHAGHLGIIALVAAVLILFSIIQNGFHFSRAGAESGAGKDSSLTYEQTGARLFAEDASQAQVPGTSDLGEQLTLIDPSLNQGAVLGATTDLSQAVGQVDQALTAEKLNQVPVKLLDSESPADLQKYAAQLELIKAYYNADSLLGNLNTTDSGVLEDTANTARKIISELLRLNVPKPLADFHKLTLVYYSALANIAKSFESDNFSDESGSAALIFFNLSDRLEKTKNQLYNQYGILL